AVRRRTTCHHLLPPQAPRQPQTRQSTAYHGGVVAATCPAAGRTPPAPDVDTYPANRPVAVAARTATHPAVVAARTATHPAVVAARTATHPVVVAARTATHPAAATDRRIPAVGPDLS